jgi:uncharacterized ferredoxin-like protein
MGIYDGNKLAQDHLLDVAWRITGAALKAPQITGRMELKTEILTGEDIIPIIEVFESTADIIPLHKVVAVQYRELIKMGQPPIFVNLGADLIRSKTGWNCGACGFATCREFNKFSRKSQPPTSMTGGPSCNWLMMDYGMATDWACAEAARCNVNNRICLWEGSVARALGYLEGCSIVLTLPIGPFTDLWYYSRPIMNKVWGYEDYKEHMIRTIPILFEPFISPLNTPRVKTTDKWWEEPKRFCIPQTDAEQEEIGNEMKKRWDKVIAKKKAEIAGKRQNLQKKE